MSAWQSATPLQIRCKSIKLVPAWVEEPISQVRQSFSGGATNNPPFPKMPYASTGVCAVKTGSLEQAENTMNNTSGV